MDSRVEYSHFRIQKANTLYDEELDRLTNRLNEFKLEILKTKNRIDETNHQLSELTEVKKADSQRCRTDLQASLAKLPAACHSRTHQLRQSLRAALQRHFE
jgi:peptidoglycan hydrolase CwlO-like protein